MKRRLVVSFLGITAVVLILLAVPTAFLLQSVAADETRDVIAREAEFVLGQAESLGPDNPQLSAAILRAVPSATSVFIIFPSGEQLTFNEVIGDPSIVQETIGASGIIVVLSTDDASIRGRVSGAMGVLSGLGVAGLLATWLLAQAEARRLGRPLEELAATAARLGSGDFTVVAARSGFAEYDLVATALNESAARVGTLLHAERQFNSDAGHQLRSALTGLRLRLEEMTLSSDPEFAADASAALDQADRLNTTIDDLLRLARTGRAGISRNYDLRALALDHLADIRVLLRRSRRQLIAPGGPPVMVEGSAGAIGQALDVLLNNAAIHGRGTVTMTIATTDVWVELLVADNGRMDLEEPDALFIQRDQGGPHGIGLRLARRLVESEGGTIDVLTPDPTTFRIRLPLASMDEGAIMNSAAVGSSTK